MVTAAAGTSNVRFPKPSFTYTKTLANLLPSATTLSAVFGPLQAGSWLMSIFAALGAVPGAADSSLGFLLHAASRTRATTAHTLRVINDCFRFMISLYLSWNWDETFAIFYRAPPGALPPDGFG